MNLNIRNKRKKTPKCSNDPSWTASTSKHFHSLLLLRHKVLVSVWRFVCMEEWMWRWMDVFGWRLCWHGSEWSNQVWTKFMLHTLFYFSFYFVVSLAAVQCHDSVKYIHTFFFSYHLQILNPLCHHKIFSTVFVLASILFISILLFIIFFLLLILGFFFSFSNDFRWNIRLFTWEGRGI